VQANRLVDLVSTPRGSTRSRCSSRSSPTGSCATGAFTSPHDLATQMLAFVEHYNLTARPFRWTYTGKVLAA
jgi:hypothetical protein